jgi:Histidine kinase-, DNA gyrase B-, and HSP90-like ATPase
MEIDTKYAVKLFFSSPAFNQIYFEAVANAFDASASEVSIHISTDGKISPDYLEITISDNGLGFTDERFDRFQRLKEPQDAYHKGLGRLVYLHYFTSVYVESTFESKKRTFTFLNTFEGDSETVEASQPDQQGSILQFRGFVRDRLKSYDDLKPKVLKNKLIEHFLPYFYEKKKAGESFKISIKLETETRNDQKEFFPDTQIITDADIPQFETRTIKDFHIDAYTSVDISMSYALRQGMGEDQLLTAISIDGRTIPIDLLRPKAIPLNHSAIFFFESELFVGKSDSSRQRFLLPEDVSVNILNKVLRREISVVLNEELPEIVERNTKTKQLFEEKYPHLIGLFDENTVGIIDKDEAIDMAQRRFFKDQKEVLESGSLDDATFEKSLEISSRALTEYILYRELIIKRLSMITSEDDEADIHNLIVPKYKQYHQDALMDGIYSNNAWLLDDKYMSFRTILSEEKMKRVISAITLNEDAAGGDGRPDISMVFSADPDLEEKVDAVVIEIKRRAVDDKEGPYAATQLIKRARKLVDHCPNIQRIWYFGIIEIDEALSQTLLDMNWTPIFSKGKVFYQDFQVKKADGTSVPTPVVLLSFDAVIKDAASRNHTFLEILKNDIRKAKGMRGRSVLASEE